MKIKRKQSKQVTNAIKTVNLGQRLSKRPHLQVFVEY